MAQKLALSAPWVTFYHQINQLFKRDPEIKIVYDEEANNIKLFVDNVRKAEALTKILPVEKYFGNVVLKITVIPYNEDKKTKIEWFEEAFENNPIFQDAWTFEGFANPISYVIFENKVVQFFNDDLNDAHGLCSTLYENIARDVFEDCSNICFCTEPGEDVYIPKDDDEIEEEPEEEEEG